MMPSLRSFCSQPNVSDFGPDQALSPLWKRSATRERWEQRLRPALEKSWRELLGQPTGYPPGGFGSAQKVAEFDGPECRFTTYLQPSGPNGQVQKVIILRPHDLPARKVPGAIVPFYDPERMAGLEPDAFGQGIRLAGPPAPGESYKHMGLHLARMGMIVACVEAFPFNTISDPGGERFDWWRKASAKLLADHPDWTGIDKLLTDTSLSLDLLLEQPGVDRRRVVAYGHSLGGKMAFYTAAFDPRVTAIIGSDFGLPWRATNWDAAWYHGEERVARAEAAGMAHHQLLALLAPRPFLLLAGEADMAEAWQYLEAARPVYALYGAEKNLGCIFHAAGHRPPLAAIDMAYGWLGEVFRLPHRRWMVR